MESGIWLVNHTGERFCLASERDDGDTQLLKESVEEMSNLDIGSEVSTEQVVRDFLMIYLGTHPSIEELRGILPLFEELSKKEYHDEDEIIETIESLYPFEVSDWNV